MRFASFLFGVFTTMAVINPPEQNWQNATLCAVRRSCLYEIYDDDPVRDRVLPYLPQTQLKMTPFNLHTCLDHQDLSGTIHKYQISSLYRVPQGKLGFFSHFV